MGLLPLLFGAVVSATQTTAGCASNDECQLNGLCVNSVCNCDAAWGGDRCQYLALEGNGALAYGGPTTNVTSWVSCCNLSLSPPPPACLVACAHARMHARTHARARAHTRTHTYARSHAPLDTGGRTAGAGQHDWRVDPLRHRDCKPLWVERMAAHEHRCCNCTVLGFVLAIRMLFSRMV
jgi:hypothetical protein